MKIALISDIHANLPALSAVLEDVKARRIECVYHLGDLVGYAPWPNETVSALRDAGIAGVSGNYDSTVATDYKHCGCKYEDPHQEVVNAGSVGRPKDGDWRAGYVVLDASEVGTSVDFIRVEYDVKLAAQAIRASSLPSEFADYLLSGGNFMSAAAGNSE